MSELILVTGGAGFLASHIVTQLLEGGYCVRTTARGNKVSQLKDALSRFGDNLEVVDVPDIASGVIPLEGVAAVIHTASPLVGAGDAKYILHTAIEGSLNVLRQTHAAGIKRFVFTSSIVAVYTANMTLTDQDWNSTPIEAVEGGPPSVAYVVSKTEAEKAVWEFGQTHPELDITTVNPPYLYGPFAEGFPIPQTPNWNVLSSNINIFRLLTPRGKFPGASGYLDVRDAAKVHVLALRGKNDRTPERKKRLIITSPYHLDYNDAIKLIAQKRPELRDRLLSGPAPEYTKEKTIGFTDLGRVEEVVGLKRSDYHSWESTILDAVDSCMEIEKVWVANGHTVQIPM